MSLDAPQPDRDIAVVLRNRTSMPPLTPERVWQRGLDGEIAALSLAKSDMARPDVSATAGAWKAALHLWNDSLAAAHELVQDLESSSGALLHGIVHRREGDYDNAKYWFRRTGDHPAWYWLQARVAERLQQPRRTDGFPPGPVADAIRTLAVQGVWNPFLFTDAVEIMEKRVGDDHARTVLETIQQLEFDAVLRYLESRLG